MDTIGSSSAMSNFGVFHTLPRACAQRRLPSMVLISPLWASMRNGWASGQRGRVLVEKRWWNTIALEARSARCRSG